MKLLSVENVAPQTVVLSVHLDETKTISEDGKIIPDPIFVRPYQWTVDKAFPTETSAQIKARIIRETKLLASYDLAQLTLSKTGGTAANFVDIVGTAL